MISPAARWGIRIVTGPDAWWWGDEEGPYIMPRHVAEAVAAEMNIDSNERFRWNLATGAPHYRYAASQLPLERAPSEPGRGSALRQPPALPGPGSKAPRKTRKPRRPR